MYVICVHAYDPMLGALMLIVRIRVVLTCPCEVQVCDRIELVCVTPMLGACVARVELV